MGQQLYVLATFSYDKQTNPSNIQGILVTQINANKTLKIQSLLKGLEHVVTCSYRVLIV